MKKSFRNFRKRLDLNPLRISIYSEINLKGTGFSNSKAFPKIQKKKLKIKPKIEKVAWRIREKETKINMNQIPFLVQ